MQHRKGQEYNSPSYCWYVQVTYTLVSHSQTTFSVSICGGGKRPGYLTLDFFVLSIKHPVYGQLSLFMTSKRGVDST